VRPMPFPLGFFVFPSFQIAIKEFEQDEYDGYSSNSNLRLFKYSYK